MSAVATQPKIALAGIGTKGDLFPLLALGRELVQRGHQCHLLGNEGAAALPRATGWGSRPSPSSRWPWRSAGGGQLERVLREQPLV